jgi:hypothetical protein
MNTITCPHCGKNVEIDKALEGQIEARVLAAEQLRHSEELAKLKAEQDAAIAKAGSIATEMAKKQLEGEKELLLKQAAADLDLEKKRIAQELMNEQRKVDAAKASEVTQLRSDNEASKEESKKLREDLSKLMTSLREERKAKENAELEAQKKLAAEEAKIREEVLKSADEKHHLRQLEMEKKLADTQKALEDAQRKATQGSQQNQGEVLELDLENRLREEFPFDDISEVKKGQRGADIVQTVKNQSFNACGMLLWETKNGKWQPAWISKFKQDIREANANIGVIVSQEMPTEYGDMKHLEANVWAVKPHLAPVLAAALRGTILQVDMANRNSEGKDVKMEALYQFLVGPEFRHRVEAIVENYGTLQQEIEKEKRAAALRWAHQEKAIRAVIDNTIGMYGDLQGITQRSLPTIKALELDDGLEEEEQSSLIL